ncbi:MAG: phosphoribosyltransferase [Planctomycetes bacterium]|nr:phosphoribosyltransferase [Planctomycetota bacterium]
MRFRDRVDAAKHLAASLEHLRSTRPLVLAIPRGGVPLGAEIARQLRGDLDLVFAHKIGAPGNPELALGAVSSDGEIIVDDRAQEFGFHPEDVRAAGEAELIRLRARAARMRRGPGIDPRSRVVIVVDDGAATGSTLVAALRCIARRKPARLVAAVPIASIEAHRLLFAYADEVVALLVPRTMQAVGEFYDDFPQVLDETVAALLSRSELKSTTFESPRASRGAEGSAQL